MKNKKKLTVVLAAATVLAAVPVSPAKAEEIDSSTVYVKQEIYDVTLPTTAAQKFYIDPEGLIALGKGGSEVANAGTVIGHATMYAVNNSSIPVALSASYKLVDTATEDGVDLVSAVADDDAVKAIQDAATKKIAVSISAVESATDADTGGNDCGGHAFKAAAAGVDITGNTGMSTADVVYADSTAVEATYIMTAKTYKFQMKDGAEDTYDANSYEYIIDEDKDDASCLKLTIGGYCAKDADWSDYADGTKELKLDVVFKFKKVTSDKRDYTDAKVGTDEVVVGPQVRLSTSGVISITDLDGTLWKSMVLNDGNKDWSLTSKDGKWSEWDNAVDGKKEFTLTSSWISYLSGKTAKITATLTDGSTIESPAVTFTTE